MGETSCDCLVIGSGPGGSTTAWHLADAGRDVVLAEEGAYQELESTLPFSHTEMLRKYRNGGLNPAFCNPKVLYVEGRCAGGGSEINSGLYHRTPESALTHWRDAYAVRELSQEDLRPHFEWCEDVLHVSALTGHAPLASRKLAEGAASLGWKCTETPRWIRFNGEVDREGVLQGVRQSMTKTLLPQAVERGVRLLPDTRVARIVRKGRGWLAETTRDGSAHTIRASKVFVCGGATQTPALLRRSGFRKTIGDTLALHPMAKIAAEFPDEVNHESSGVPVHQVHEFAPRISFGCSISSRPYVMLTLLDYPDHARRLGERWRHMAIYYAMITGSPVGRVRNVPFSGDTLVRYSLSELDLHDLYRALRKLSLLLFRAGAVRLFLPFKGMPPLTSERDLSLIHPWLRRSSLSLTTVHLFSSCPMGEHANRSAVDSFGNVYGLPGLSVHDASILCSAPGVNPQGSIMALARRNTLRFLGKA